MSPPGTLAGDLCPTCGRGYRRRGRQRYCSAACRQQAYRDRRAAPVTARHSPRTQSIYECPHCQERYLAEQRCPACGIFCRRVGPGGPCPHCFEPVALEDLLGPA